MNFKHGASAASLFARPIVFRVVEGFHPTQATMSSLTKALSPSIREIRLLLCQSSQASSGLRQFIHATYPKLKQANPHLPILIREANGTPARAFARFEYGVEKHIDLNDLTAKDVEQKLTQLLSS
ncbi:NADH dehydrogenase alpha subcomplex subunit 2 [Pyrrhoderma noxium]|uniref:NADH dehydrogenase alpha subcomplex subunit 2 n=1 Tax=Pyrrhoderma noxium TaxID=2282107 RepID=A0A286UDJ2_9AGAM|nr:NADH dehydrogenase alpha subcomplex subunit 2 [Pyrrhoderma noxium]